MRYTIFKIAAEVATEALRASKRIAAGATGGKEISARNQMPNPIGVE